MKGVAQSKEIKNSTGTAIKIQEVRGNDAKGELRIIYKYIRNLFAVES